MRKKRIQWPWGGDFERNLKKVIGKTQVHKPKLGHPPEA
jgi:hypothetical protein